MEDRKVNSSPQERMEIYGKILEEEKDCLIKLLCRIAALS